MEPELIYLENHQKKTVKNIDYDLLASIESKLKNEILGIIDLYNYDLPCHASDNFSVLRKLSIRAREEFARVSRTMVLYHGAEVDEVKKAEETAALYALPAGYDYRRLNVVNVGAGKRLINPTFISTDAFRSADTKSTEISGRHHEADPSAILSTIRSLPFKKNSIDAILSLHSLEHEVDPIKTLCKWVNIIKPGGGIGLVLPDYRYTYSAKNDDSEFGHKWDPFPDLIENWHHRHLRHIVMLERINTYPFRLSFDVILRKPGNFISFDEKLQKTKTLSGRNLYKIKAMAGQVL